MTSTTTVASRSLRGSIARRFAQAHETVVYPIVFGVLVYAIGLTGRVSAPRHVGLSAPPLYVLTINLVLLALFALRHRRFACARTRQLLCRIVALARCARHGDRRGLFRARFRA